MKTTKALNSPDRRPADCLALEPRVLLNADFNHDGRTDLVWHNKSTGEVVIWEVQNDTVESSPNLPTVPAEWDIVGYGDFNRNGDDDILWRNSQTGENVMWLMDSESLSSTHALPAVAPSSGWEAQAVGDFTSDLRADIVWRNYLTGENVVWVIDDSQNIDRSDSISSVADAAWHIVGAADLNDDLHTDLLWRNDDTSQTVVWLMDGRTHTGDHTLPTVQGTEWHIGAVGNFTGDLDEDILWRRYTDGSNIVWRMDNTAVAGDMSLPPLADGDWTIGGGDNRVTGADWNRDGREDILWLNPQNGRGLVWYVSSTTILGTNSINNLGQQVRGLVAVEDFDGERGVDFLTHNASTGEVSVILRVAGTANFTESRRGEIVTIALPSVSDPAWQVVGVGDFNGDESPDILWRNSNTGEDTVWLLSRGAFAGAIQLNTVPTEWQVQAVHSNDSADTADIFWRNTATGEDVVWTVSGNQITSTRSLFTVEDQSWRIGTAYDADFNGYTDVIWYNSDLNECRIWFYNSGGYSGTVLLGQLPTSNSAIVP